VAKELVHILKVNSYGIRVDNDLSKLDHKLVFVIIANFPDMNPIFEWIQIAGEFHNLRVERVKDIIGDYRITEKIIG